MFPIKAIPKSVATKIFRLVILMFPSGVLVRGITPGQLTCYKFEVTEGGLLLSLQMHFLESGLIFLAINWIRSTVIVMVCSIVAVFGCFGMCYSTSYLSAMPQHQTSHRTSSGLKQRSTGVGSGTPNAMSRAFRPGLSTIVLHSRPYLMQNVTIDQRWLFR